MAMDKTTRRGFVKSGLAVTSGICAGLSGRVHARAARAKKSDIQIEHLSTSYEECAFRTPLKFAQAVVDRQTLLTVNCTVRTAAGRVATGFGTLPLNYTFTFPSKKLSETARLGAMKALAEEIATVTAAYKEFGHPIDINWELAPVYLKTAADVSRRL